MSNTQGKNCFVARGWIALWLGALAGMLIGWIVAHPWTDQRPSYRLPQMEEAHWIAPVFSDAILSALKTPAPRTRFTPGEQRTNSYFRLPLNFTERPERIWFEWQAHGSASIYWNGKRLGLFSGADARFSSDLTDLTSLANPGTHVLAVEVLDERSPSLAALHGVLCIRSVGGTLSRISTSDPRWEASTTAFQDYSAGLFWNRPSFKPTLLGRPEILRDPPWRAPQVSTFIPPGLFECDIQPTQRWRWRGDTSSQIRTRIPGKAGEVAYLLVRSTNPFFIYGSGEEGVAIDARADWSVRPLHLERSGWFEWTLAFPPSEADAFLEMSVWRMSPDGTLSAVKPVAENTRHNGSVQPVNLVVTPTASMKMAPTPVSTAQFHWSRFFACTLVCMAAGGILAGRAWTTHARLQRAILYGVTAALGWLAVGAVIQWARFSADPSNATTLLGGWFVLGTVVAGVGSGILIWRKNAVTTPVTAPRRVWWRGAGLVALILIGTLGFVVRWQQVEASSLDQDELTLVMTASSIPKFGIPGAMLRNGFKALATYELVTYSIIAGVALNGWSEFGVRVHSLMYGSLSVLLLWVWGRRMFGPAAGWALMLIGALIPWSISMSGFTFYPAQVQFFLLLTLIFFYMACSPVRVRMGWLALATLFFIITYLSWEGTGFVLIGLAVGVLLIRPKQWQQVFRPGFIIALVTIICVVLLQRGYRVLSTEPYAGIGPGLASINPLAFLKNDGSVDALFYVNQLLFLEHHWPLTLLFLAGLPLALTWRSYRFVLGVFLTMFLSYTFLLSSTALRYGYVMQVLLLGLGIGGARMLWRHLCTLTENRPPYRSTPGLALERILVCLPWCVVLLLTTNSRLIDSDTIRPLGSGTQDAALLDRQLTDFRRACHVAGMLKPKNEPVIVTFPHAYRFYAGAPADYVLQTTWKGKLILFPDKDKPQIVDRFGGVQTIINRHQLSQTLSRTITPTWLVLTPSSLAISLMQPEVWSLLDAGSETIFESSRAVVLRFDPLKVPAKTWSNFTSHAIEIP